MPENELKVLRWFAQGAEGRQSILFLPTSILAALSKDLGLDKDECKVIINNLNAEGLIEVDSKTMTTIMTQDGAYAKRTTAAGDQFLVTHES